MFIGHQGAMAEKIPEATSESMGIPGSNRWRYVSTIFLAIFCGDIPLHSPKNALKNGPYMPLSEPPHECWACLASSDLPNVATYVRMTKSSHRLTRFKTESCSSVNEADKSGINWCIYKCIYIYTPRIHVQFYD